MEEVVVVLLIFIWCIVAPVAMYVACYEKTQKQYLGFVCGIVTLGLSIAGGLVFYACLSYSGECKAELQKKRLDELRKNQGDL